MSNIFFQYIILFYLCFPIFVFLIGFINLSISVILMLLLLYVIYRLKISEIQCFHYRSIELLTILFVFLFLTGHGGFISAGGIDIPWRNAIYQDLIKYPWPVIYEYSDSALVYYITYWLVPAGISYLFDLGETGSYIVLFAWTYLGLTLFFLLICDYLKVKKNQMVVVCLIFLFWSGLNILGMLPKSIFAKTAFQIDAYNWFNTWLFAGGEYNGYPLNYFIRTTFDAVSNVYNQFIPVGIGTLLFLKFKDRIEYYAVIGLLVLPYSPLGFIGIICLMLGMFIYQSNDIICKNGYKYLAKKVFSLPNICASVTILPVFYFYFTTNLMAGNEKYSVFYVPLHEYGLMRVGLLLLYYLVYFGIYYFLIYENNKKNPLFWISGVLLIIFPFFRVGAGQDLNMNASIAPFIVVMLLVMKEILYTWDKKCFYGKQLFLVIALSIAMLTPLMQITNSLRCCYLEGKRAVLLDPHNINGTLTDKNVKKFENFLSDQYKESIFYKYLAK